MDLFAPENRESTETYRESKILNPDVEKRIIDRVADGHESFPDAPICPITRCKNPLHVDISDV